MGTTYLSRALMSRAAFLGLTAADIAHAASYAPSAISNVLRGHRTPTEDFLAAVLAVLDMTATDLVREMHRAEIADRERI